MDTILAHCIHGNGSLVGDEQSHDSNGTGVIGRPRRSEGDGCDASELYGMYFSGAPFVNNLDLLKKV